MTRFAFLLCLPALLLSGCGRTEPVSEPPSQEELAAAANEAAAKAIANQQDDEKAGDRTYTDSARRFSVTFPEGWTPREEESGPDTIIYEDPGAGADAKVSWDRGDANRTLRQVVEASTSGIKIIDGDYIGENEYRGAAKDEEGNSIALRLLRYRDGAGVVATLVYPEMLSEQYQGIAGEFLDSLQILAPDGQDTASAAAH